MRIPDLTISVNPPPCSSHLNRVISSQYLSLQITIFSLISDMDISLFDSRRDSALRKWFDRIFVTKYAPGVDLGLPT